MLSGYSFLPKESVNFPKTQKMPHHLAELESAFTLVSVPEADEEKYAEIAFLLFRVGEGDKDALKRVAEYIQQQHRDKKALIGYFTKFLEQISKWMVWAKYWTVKSPEKIEEKDIVYPR